MLEDFVVEGGGIKWVWGEEWKKRESGALGAFDVVCGRCIFGSVIMVIDGLCFLNEANNDRKSSLGVQFMFVRRKVRSIHNLVRWAVY